MTFDVAAALLKSNAKKKRRYLMLLSKAENADSRDLKTIERAVASALPEHTILRIDDPDEAIEVIGVKAVDFVLLDRSLLDDEEMSVNFALEIKRRKPTPIFFFTKDDDKLISIYREKMFAYEELDDYFLCPVDFVELGRKLRRASTVEGRAAKRFGMEHPIRFFRLDSNSLMDATLADVSMVGFGMTMGGAGLLHRGEQVQVRIPLSAFNMFHPDYGEFLRLAGKVRRISLDGRRIGCSIEHMTPLQQEVLSKLLETVMRRMRSARAASLASKEQQAQQSLKNSYGG